MLSVIGHCRSPVPRPALLPLPGSPSPVAGRLFPVAVELLGANWGLSLQSRHQFIPEQGFGDAKPGAPKHTAHAIFARAYYFFGEDRMQLFGTFTLSTGGHVIF